MIRKRLPYLVAGGIILAALLAVTYLLRLLTIEESTGETVQIRAAALTTGQALAAAGVRLGEFDQVEPALDRPVPLDGRIRIQRAVQAYVWNSGQIRAVIGLEQTAGELLTAAGIQLGQNDGLLWNGLPLALNEPLPRGQTLVLQIERAQPVIVISGEQEQRIMTRGPTAAHALLDAGVLIGPGDWLQVDPGSQLEPGMVIGHTAARRLTILVGERRISAWSAAKTTGAALAEAGVALMGLDYSQPPEDQPPPEDGQVRVVRVREEILLHETLTPFESKFAPDPELDLDHRRTLEPGQYGVQVSRERVRYEDGQEVQRRVDSDWTASQPQEQTIGYGTKVVIQTADTPDGSIEYYRKVRVYATSYSPCRLGTGDGRCSWTTASGMRLTKGIIGVSRRWFRVMVGQQVYVPGYGFGTIGDYGALRGMWIDLGFDEENFEEGAFVGWVDLYFLTPVPDNILWTLP